MGAKMICLFHDWQKVKTMSLADLKRVAWQEARKLNNKNAYDTRIVSSEYMEYPDNSHYLQIKVCLKCEKMDDDITPYLEKMIRKFDDHFKEKDRKGQAKKIYEKKVAELTPTEDVVE
jgi:hypothetical protein